MMDYSVAEAPHSRSFRFSGHETFAFRYAWLPKAYRLLKQDQSAFSDEDNAMIELGLGKNMVRALRFWVEASGLAQPVTERGLELTDFAHDVFGPEGFDPYLEDTRTLWLLHWNLSARSEGTLFAWRFLLNYWPFPELTRSEAWRRSRANPQSLGTPIQRLPFRNISMRFSIPISPVVRARSASRTPSMGRWSTCPCCNRSVSGKRMAGGGTRFTLFGASPSRTSRQPCSITALPIFGRGSATERRH
jgi:hypothetical protein